MLEGWLGGIADLMRTGGAVMPVLAATGAGLWYGVGLRWLQLRGDRRPAEILWAEAVAGRLTTRGPLADAARSAAAAVADRTERREEAARIAVAAVDDAVRKYRSVVQGLVFAAPLLGLLGTVSGMIETFDALGQQAMFRQSGGIAGGIAEALLTTQLGLCVAIPGTLVGRMLEQREDHLHAEIAHLVRLAAQSKEVACAA